MQKRIRIRRKATGFLMVAGMVAAMSTSAIAYPLQDGPESTSQQSVGGTENAGCSLHPRLRNVESELYLRGTVEVPTVTEAEFSEVEAPQPAPSDGFNVQWIAILAGAVALLAIAAMSIK